MNGHFIGFHQLVQKLQRITPIISAIQDKQNDWSYVKSFIDRFKTYFYSSRQINKINGHFIGFHQLLHKLRRFWLKEKWLLKITFVCPFSLRYLQRNKIDVVEDGALLSLTSLRDLWVCLAFLNFWFRKQSYLLGFYNNQQFTL